MSRWGNHSYCSIRWLIKLVWVSCWWRLFFAASALNSFDNRRSGIFCTIGLSQSEITDWNMCIIKCILILILTENKLRHNKAKMKYLTLWQVINVISTASKKLKLIKLIFIRTEHYSYKVLCISPLTYSILSNCNNKNDCRIA